MEIKKVQEEIHEVAKGKGWYAGKRNIGEMIALCHSELSEALEEYRVIKDIGLLQLPEIIDGKPEGFSIELADVIIRVLDLAEYLKIDMEECIRLKIEYNKTRPYRHGGKRA